jgi:hypothetical protein
MNKRTSKNALPPNSLSGRNKETSDGIDLYETPAYVTEALLDRETFIGTILEPCCGNGAICDVLEKRGIAPIFGCDIRTDDRVWSKAQKNVDFRSAYLDDSFDNIITNPPFYCAKEIIENALRVSEQKVAMFLKLVFLESARRYEFFQNTPLETVYVFSKRVNLFRDSQPIPENSGTMAFAWFVWNHDKPEEQEPRIRWIP